MLTVRVSVILKGSRQDLDISQEGLGRLLGWTRATVANLECGRRTLTFVDFVVIATVLKVEPDRLLRRVLLW